MAAKKKVVKKERINPPVTIWPEGVMFEDMDVGDCFIWESRLLIKTDGPDQNAVDLLSGDTYDEMCVWVVIPVDIEINWKKKQC